MIAPGARLAGALPQRRELLSAFLRLLVPAAVCLGYAGVFRHRADYTAHFLAGWGVGLVACEILHALGRPRQPALRVLSGVAGVFVLGVAAEATLFNSMGRFDLVDMSNQSLGAIMGGLVSEWSDEHRTRSLTVVMLLAGLLAAGGGFVVNPR